MATSRREQPGVPRRWRPFVICVVVTLGSGCATLPPDPVQRALYSDLRQIVDTRQRVGWIIDSSEYEDAAPAVLGSVCQVQEEKRIELLNWLDGRIEAEGGPAEVAYEQAGEDLSEVEEILTLERMRGALEYADERADRDCPFFIKPDPEFAGVQTDVGRFIILGESFGGLSIIMRSDGVLLGGGGVLRILPGYGFNHRITVAAGVELGGTGAISQSDESGEQSLAARPVGGIPIVLRVHDETWVYDVELAALTQYHDKTLSIPPGLRVAGAVGIKTVRIGSFMPIAVGVIAYELMPEFRDLPTSHALRIGTRVGVDYDP